MKRIAGLAKSIVGIGLASAMNASHAQVAGIEFSFSSGIGGPVSGVGSLVTPATALTPGATTTGADTLLSLYIWLEGIPKRFGPTTTTFQQPALADNPWLLQTDSEGNIVDLNFFGRDGTVNIDGYSLEGYSMRTFYLCDGPAALVECAGGPSAVIDSLEITVTAVSIIPSIPEPHALLLMLTGLGIAEWKRRHVVRLDHVEADGPVGILGAQMASSTTM